MFEPEKLPQPDEYGYFFHPDIPGEEESDDVRAMLRKLGYRAAVVQFEYDAPDEVCDDYYEREDQTAVGRWKPTVPDGDGWQLVAKYDTEDGPCALFVQTLTDDDCKKCGKPWAEHDFGAPMPYC
jgi:hypothetical protein